MGKMPRQGYKNQESRIANGKRKRTPINEKRQSGSTCQVLIRPVVVLSPIKRRGSVESRKCP